MLGWLASILANRLPIVSSRKFEQIGLAHRTRAFGPPMAVGEEPRTVDGGRSRRETANGKRVKSEGQTSVNDRQRARGRAAWSETFKLERKRRWAVGGQYR
jgi:hypothetical protein